MIKSKVAKKFDLATSESDVNKLDIDRFKKLPSNLSDLKSKIDILDVNKLVPVPIDLSKLSNAVKSDAVKKMYVMLRSKILKIKYLISLT